MAGSRTANVQITFLGHSAFRLVSPEHKVVLVDPFLSQNPVCAPEYRDPERIEVDYILVTHDHSDHLGDTVDLARRTGATVVACYDLAVRLGGQGLDVNRLIGPSIGGMARIGDLELFLVPAVHSASPSIGFVIGFSNGLRVYHAGDTALFSDMALIRRLYRPQVALLPIGGYYTMDPQAAGIAASEYLQPEIVVPMHYGSFPVLTGTPEQLRRHMSGAREEVAVLAPGQSITI